MSQCPPPRPNFILTDELVPSLSQMFFPSSECTPLRGFIPYSLLPLALGLTEFARKELGPPCALPPPGNLSPTGKLSRGGMGSYHRVLSDQSFRPPK